LRRRECDEPFRIAILDDYAGIALRMADWSSIERTCDITVFREHLSAEEAVRSLQDFDIVCTIRERMDFSRALLRSLPRLKLLTVIGQNLPNIDALAARELGIVVQNARGDIRDRAITENATPELAWGLLLALARNIPGQNQTLRPEGWQTSPGRVLAGKTMGILGLGKLGGRVARFARAFDMQIVAWSPNLTEERAAAVGARLVTKGQLFERSDAISVHVRLSDRSRSLVDADALGRMKPSAYLINTSRAPIIDQSALIEALRIGRIAGAALDVFDEEPLPAGDILRTLPNVILTPHLGYFTEETMSAFYKGTVQAVADFIDRQ
jgi:phosphoglycerate dehydrogenase-like enzyme